MEKVFHFHVNPPEKGVKRATFTGVVSNTDLHIGLAECSKKDQFDRKKGRLISAGRAVKTPIITANVAQVEDRNLCDTFVNLCKEWAVKENYIVNYPRRKKRVIVEE